RLVEQRDRVAQAGEDGVVGPRRIWPELEALDLLQRQPPTRAAVLEGADLELELAALGSHLSDRDRRPARVQHPPAVAGHEPGQLARCEVPVGRRVGIGLVHGASRVAHPPTGRYALTGPAWPVHDHPTA